MWSFSKPVIVKNTSRFRANTFGVYSYNGSNAATTYKNSKRESVVDFLRIVREMNPFTHIVMILDNFSSHRTEEVAVEAEILDIELVFLPPYSPQLNPIEFIWKSIKRVVSTTFFRNQEEFIETVKMNFIHFARDRSFCSAWMTKFVDGEVQ